MEKCCRDTANMQELFQPVGEQQDSQQIKKAWQAHIEAVATVYEDAKRCSGTMIGKRLLDFLESQMPLAYADSISMQTVTEYSQKRSRVFIKIKGNNA